MPRELIKVRTAAVLSSSAAILLAGLAVGCAGHSTDASGHRTFAGARHVAARHAGMAARVKGAIAPGALSCTGIGPAMGAVGVLKPGEASDAEQALGSDLMAQATDTVSGSLMFFAPAALSLKLSTYFSKIDMVHAQAATPQLHSCYMMLSNVPAAKPVIAAAEQALVDAHLVASLSILKNELQEVLVADNVLRAGSVIVTLQVVGAKHAPVSSGGPSTFSLAAFTVVMDYPSDEITSVMRGGL